MSSSMNEYNACVFHAFGVYADIDEDQEEYTRGEAWEYALSPAHPWAKDIDEVLVYMYHHVPKECIMDYIHLCNLANEAMDSFEMNREEITKDASPVRTLFELYRMYPIRRCAEVMDGLFSMMYSNLLGGANDEMLSKAVREEAIRVWKEINAKTIEDVYYGLRVLLDVVKLDVV